MRISPEQLPIDPIAVTVKETQYGIIFSIDNAKPPRSFFTLKRLDEIGFHKDLEDLARTESYKDALKKAERCLHPANPERA